MSNYPKVNDGDVTMNDTPMPLSIDTSITSPVSPSSMDIDVEPTSADLPRAVLFKKSPSQYSPNSKLTLSKEISTMNNQLDDMTQKLTTTLMNYKKVMNIYGNGYEISVQLATQLAKTLVALRAKASEEQEKLKDKSVELKKIENLEAQLKAKNNEFSIEREKLSSRAAQISADAATQMRALEIKINELQTANVRLQNEISGHKEMTAKERQEKVATCGELNRTVIRLNNEHKELVEALRVTFEKVRNLDTLIVRNMNELSIEEAKSRKRKARVLDEHTVEFENLTKTIGEIQELSKLYKQLTEKGNPDPRKFKEAVNV